MEEERRRRKKKEEGEKKKEEGEEEEAEEEMWNKDLYPQPEATFPGNPQIFHSCNRLPDLSTAGTTLEIPS